MFKRIRKFTGRTAGMAAMLMTIGLTTPAIATAGVVTCTWCFVCLLTCPIGGCALCFFPCLGCAIPLP